MLSVSDVLTISITKNLFNLHTLLSLDPRDFSSGIVDQSSADFLRGTLPHLTIWSGSGSPLDCHEPHHFLLSKVTLNINDANREQASLANKCLIGS
jgi:hypothetical protein